MKHYDNATESHAAQHDSPIKTPAQLTWAVVASFVVPVLVIILLANFVVWGDKPAAGTDALGEQAVAKRIAPIGSVTVKDPTDVATLKTGEQVYLAQCTACHAIGAAGAPKTGDTAAWAPRLKQGYDVLLTSVLKGKGAMGAQGGGDFSDLEIARAVVYLANKSGGSLAEPAAPAAAPAAAASAAN
jgi:cytochrome c5